MTLKRYGGWAGVVLLILAAAFVAMFAATAGGAIAAFGIVVLVGLLVGAALYGLWGRTWDRIRHGIPMLRRGSGGDSDG